MHPFSNTYPDSRNECSIRTAQWRNGIKDDQSNSMKEQAPKHQKSQQRNRLLSRPPPSFIFPLKVRSDKLRPNTAAPGASEISRGGLERSKFVQGRDNRTSLHLLLLQPVAFRSCRVSFTPLTITILFCDRICSTLFESQTTPAHISFDIYQTSAQGAENKEQLRHFTNASPIHQDPAIYLTRLPTCHQDVRRRRD
jgi:hypothetical protein